MMALAGRECSLYAFNDIVPTTLLWLLRFSLWLMSFYVPIQNCHWFTNHSRCHVGRHLWPTIFPIFCMVCLSIVGAAIHTFCHEMWSMWDPYGTGLNNFSWTLGIAAEIDNMLHDFYEVDAEVVIRRHFDMAAEECESVEEESGTEEAPPEPPRRFNPARISV